LWLALASRLTSQLAWRLALTSHLALRVPLQLEPALQLTSQLAWRLALTSQVPLAFGASWSGVIVT